MELHVMIFHVVLLCISDPSLSSEVIQTADVIENPGSNVNLSCKHTYNNYFYLYWYQQPRQDTALKLTGHLYTTTFNRETDYEKRFHIYGDAKSEATLQISNLNAHDSAVYFCAVRTGGSASQAYFGSGTKLTVLDKDIKITSPTVRVLNVSQNAMCTKKNVTLVCLAEKFYPDHVTVSWTVGGEKRTTDVGTDEAATQGEDKFYTISSRLNIEYKEWTKGQEFTCIVSFFNGSNTTEYEQSITSAKVDDNEYRPEQYIRSGNMTRLAYGFFIVKSFVYGLFVMYIVKRQGLFSK